jgi:phenylacetate-CoA ligase
MEFVDENGEAVALGETGEIVCTSLFNKAMPFIRYALDDVGMLSDEDECPCGRTLPLMKVMEGRKDEVIILPGSRAISAFAIIAAMYRLSFYNQIKKFRVIQKGVEHFKLLLSLNEDGLDEKAVETELKQVFIEALNLKSDEVTFEVEFVDEIPLDKSGKFRIVISEVV